MSRDVRVVILCEDDQHKQFVKRFLGKYLRWSQRDLSKFLRVNMHQKGAGSAERYVREKYLDELELHRIGNVMRNDLRLIVMIDGDKEGVEARLHSLDKSCSNKNVSLRKNSEKIAVLVPTWNIETWLAYLKGETVDETRKDYPKAISSEDFQSCIEALVRMCRENKLGPPAPRSLEAACKEFERLRY